MKSKKVLTNLKKFARLDHVVIINKLKGRKMASNDKTETTKKTAKTNALKSIAWLIEASFRGFAGWVLLSNFDHLVTTIAAVYALATAAIIVVTHFVKAHK